MATQRQIAANRANALKSMGPRTDAGKAASSQNSLKHGLTARGLLLAGESAEEYEAFRLEFQEHHAPKNASEASLVDALASSFWRLRRVPVFEAMMLEREKYQFKGIEAPDPFRAQRAEFKANTPGLDIYRSLSDWILQNDVLGKLARYEADLLRNIQRIYRMVDACNGTARRKQITPPPKALPPS